MTNIISALSDQSSQQKRLSALKALSRIASFCGLAISPYYDYPNLLGILTNLVQNETSQDIRVEALKAFGVLGAIDPYEYKQIGEGVASNTPVSYPGHRIYGKRGGKEGGQDFSMGRPKEPPQAERHRWRRWWWWWWRQQ